MYNNSDELVIILNAIESTCAVEFYTVVDTGYATHCPIMGIREGREYDSQRITSYCRSQEVLKKIPILIG